MSEAYPERELRMPQRKRVQTIKVKDYGDDWINRLAVLLQTLEQMEPEERHASLKFAKSKYRREWPSDEV